MHLKEVKEKQLNRCEDQCDGQQRERDRCNRVRQGFNAISVYPELRTEVERKTCEAVQPVSRTATVELR